MTHYEQLLEQLPPERRVAAAMVLEKLSNDPNSPIFKLYAEVLASVETKSQERENRLIKKLAETETREKQLAAQIAKGQADTIKSVGNVVHSITGKGLGWRIVANKLVGTLIFVIVASIVGNQIIHSKVRTVDPVFHERISTAESEIKKRIDDQAQLTNLKHDHLADLIRENTDLIKKTHVTTAAETLLGKGISYYVSEVSDTHISVSTNGRTLVLPHDLTRTEMLQLKFAINTTTKIKLK